MPVPHCALDHINFPLGLKAGMVTRVTCFLQCPYLIAVRTEPYIGLKFVTIKLIGKQSHTHFTFDFFFSRKSHLLSQMRAQVVLWEDDN